MRNTLSVLALLAFTTALAAPTYAVDQDTGAGTHIVATVDTADAFVADAFVITAAHDVPFVLLDTHVAQVPVVACSDCKSERLDVHTCGVLQRLVIKGYKPHGHWLC